MKTQAVVFASQGQVELRTAEIRDLADNEVLIRAHFSTISPGTELRTLAGREPTASPFPLIPGYSTTGEVHRVGDAVRGLSKGTLAALRGGQPLNSELGSSWGGHSAYLIVPESEVFALPDGIDLKHATLMTLLATALHGMDRANARIGEKVAVVGLGLVGQLCARLLRHAGAQVLATDLNAHRRAVAEAAGVSTVEPTKILRDAFDPQFPYGAEAVVDATGSSAVLKSSLSLLRDRPRLDPCGGTADSGGGGTLVQTLERESFLNNGWRGPRLIAQGSYADPIRIDYHDLFGNDAEFIVPRVHEPAAVYRSIALLSDKRLSFEGLISESLAPKDAIEAYLWLGERPDDVLTLCFDWRVA